MSWTSGVGISVPLLFWQHQNGEVAEAKHLELELAATQRDVFAQVEQDLRNAYSTATTSYRQAVFIRDELLPSAQEQYDIAFKTYSLGGASCARSDRLAERLARREEPVRYRARRAE